MILTVLVLAQTASRSGQRLSSTMDLRLASKNFLRRTYLNLNLESDPSKCRYGHFSLLMSILPQRLIQIDPNWRNRRFQLSNEVPIVL